LLFYRKRLDTLRLCYQQEGCFFIARDWTLCVFAINKRVAFLSRETGHFASLLSTRGLLFYRKRLDTLRLCYQQEGCFFIARDWTLCVFAINKRVAFLSRETGHFASLLSTRGLLFYRERLDTLRLCYQQESCFFIARGWTLCVFAINKRVASLSQEARLLLYYFCCECNLPI
jgi:hypothetical protein